MRLSDSLVRATSMALLAGCLAMTGCASMGDNASGGSTGSSGASFGESVAPCDVAIIYADRANSAGDLSVASGYVQSAVENEAFVAGVTSDGSPRSFSGRFAMDIQSRNQKRADKERAELTQTYIDSVMNYDWAAASPESNILDAIYDADDLLGSDQATDLPNTLVVIDSGISTCGPLNFQESMARNALLDPSILINALQRSGDLVELRHIDKVVWYGMGKAAAPQEDPIAQTKRSMENLYRALFEKMGVTDVEFKTTASSGATEGHPEVTVVDMPRIPSKQGGSEDDPLRLGDELVYDDANENFKFEKDQSTFKNPEAARKELQKYIDQLVDFPDLHVTITGYSSTEGDETHNLKLSKERAAAVKDLFVTAGVQDSQVTAVGLGETEEFGSKEQNRRVVIVFDEFRDANV